MRNVSRKSCNIDIQGSKNDIHKADIVTCSDKDIVGFGETLQCLTMRNE